MRIALVTHYFPGHGGGIELVAENLARGLALQHQCQIEWFASDCDAAPSDLPPTVTAWPMRSWNGIERRTGLPFPLWAPHSLGELWAGIGRADIVHVHEFAYAGSMAATLLAHVRRRPLVITQHIGIVRSSRRTLAAAYSLGSHTLGRLMLSGAGSAVFVSESARAHHEGISGRRASFCTIYNGLDTDLFGDRPPEEVAPGRSGGVPRREPVAAFVGRFVPKKGLDIVRELATSLPHVTWWLAGRGPIDPAGWGLANVRVAGHCSQIELARLYRAADVLVLPSRFEGFPLVVQEALACGASVLTTDEVAAACPPAAPLLRCCPVSDADDPRPWIAAFRAILQDEAWLSARDLRARRAAALWSWSQCATQYFELLSSLLPRGRQSLTGPRT